MWRQDHKESSVNPEQGHKQKHLGSLDDWNPYYMFLAYKGKKTPGLVRDANIYK